MNAEVPRRSREVTSERVRQDKPAFKIVAKFGGLSKFCDICDFNTSTVQGWLVNGLIPSRYRDNGLSYQSWILGKAVEHDIPLAPFEFFDQPE